MNETIYDHANRAYTMTRFPVEVLDTQGVDISLGLSESGRQGLKCVLDCVNQEVRNVLSLDLSLSAREDKQQ